LITDRVQENEEMLTVTYLAMEKLQFAAMLWN